METRLGITKIIIITFVSLLYSLFLTAFAQDVKFKFPPPANMIGEIDWHEKVIRKVDSEATIDSNYLKMKLETQTSDSEFIYIRRVISAESFIDNNKLELSPYNGLIDKPIIYQYSRDGRIDSVYGNNLMDSLIGDYIGIDVLKSFPGYGGLLTDPGQALNDWLHLIPVFASKEIAYNDTVVINDLLRHDGVADTLSAKYSIIAAPDSIGADKVLIMLKYEINQNPSIALMEELILNMLNMDREECKEFNIQSIYVRGEASFLVDPQSMLLYKHFYVEDKNYEVVSCYGIKSIDQIRSVGSKTYVYEKK